MKKVLITSLIAALAISPILLAGPGYGNKGGARMLERYDTNNDGVVSQSEVEQVRGENFSKFDKDGNGLLSLEEWAAMREARHQERMNAGFKRHDANGDAAISRDEFVSRTDRMMSRFDRDGDHQISPDEMGAGCRNGAKHGPMHW